MSNLTHIVKSQQNHTLTSEEIEKAQTEAAKRYNVHPIKVTTLDKILEYANEHRGDKQTDAMIDVKELTSLNHAIEKNTIDSHFICVICHDLVDSPTKC